MQEFSGRVAVVTGAASGIGRGLALHCAQEGMRVVVADVNAQALAQVEAELKSSGTPVLAVETDVSKARDVEVLAEQTVETFGAVHLLFNNAGVGRLTRIWEAPLAEWEWVLGVNLWGVIHGVHYFVPVMLRQEDETHIINTASIAGIATGPGLGVYRVTKHGVVALSEVLYHELAQETDRIKVSVLCPGFVNTPIFDTFAKLRPQSLSAASPQHPNDVQLEARMRAAALAGLAPERVAVEVFAAIREERFYIFTHPEYEEVVQRRMEDMLSARNPSRV
jgi:NAD(P)-dependent dehydrogenase (short-subunit alcohol dehydrogenase family)